jgi:hypothetical protein
MTEKPRDLPPEAPQDPATRMMLAMRGDNARWGRILDEFWRRKDVITPAGTPMTYAQALASIEADFDAGRL